MKSLEDLTQRASDGGANSVRTADREHHPQNLELSPQLSYPSICQNNTVIHGRHTGQSATLSDDLILTLWTDVRFAMSSPADRVDNNPWGEPSLDLGGR